MSIRSCMPTVCLYTCVDRYIPFNDKNDGKTQDLKMVSGVDNHCGFWTSTLHWSTVMHGNTKRGPAS